MAETVSPLAVAKSVTSIVSSTINVSITITRLINQIKNTEGDVKTCLDLVGNVHAELQQLISLQTKHHKYLEVENPSDLSRIQTVISRVGSSLMSVQQSLELCRKEAYVKRGIPFTAKVKWVMGNSASFVLRSRNLSEQAASLRAEIAFLRQLELMQPLLAASQLTSSTFENLDLLCISRVKSTRSIRSIRSTSSLGQETMPVYESPTTDGCGTSLSSTRSFDPWQTTCTTELDDIRSDAKNVLCKSIGSETWQPPTTKILQNEEQEEAEDADEIAWYEDLRRQAEERDRRKGRAVPTIVEIDCTPDPYAYEEDYTY